MSNKPGLSQNSRAHSRKHHCKHLADEILVENLWIKAKRIAMIKRQSIEGYLMAVFLCASNVKNFQNCLKTQQMAEILFWKNGRIKKRRKITTSATSMKIIIIKNHHSLSLPLPHSLSKQMSMTGSWRRFDWEDETVSVRKRKEGV